ncbi:MAG: MFS transporter [Polyangiaceae bacterium]
MPRRELFTLLVLMMVQFTGISDLIILGPLAPGLTTELGKDTKWFATTILAFTVASALGNLVAAPFVDRFDRKRALLVLFSGFGAGQLVCALAPSSEVFFAGRVLGGAFAGLFSSTAGAIVGDVVPPARRGAANGIVSAAYALAFVVGVPLGLFLATRSSWRVPFYGMVGIVALVVLVGAFVLPPVRAHLDQPAARATVRAVLREPACVRALLVNGLMMFSAYTVTPFLATYVVKNLGYAESTLPSFYLVGGIVTLVAAVALGIAADNKSHLWALRVATVASLPGTIWCVVMGDHGWLATALAVVAFMAPVTGRTVPAMAMAMTAVPDALRGAMMSLNSAAQQLFLGLGAVAAGALVVETPQGLERFVWCGVLSAVAAALTLGIARAPSRASNRPSV